MEAKTLNCPMCGASSRSDASHCDHCGARLATVSCPSCFDLMFRGAKFCPNCGEAAERMELGRGKKPCPRCNLGLHLVDLGGSRLRECTKCDGLWIDNETFQEVCREREQQALFMGIPSLQDPKAVASIDPVRYLKCPTCRNLMNRVNFAGCSGVIVDVCKDHGTWFDRAELRRVIDFVRDGGMDKAREREIRNLAAQRRALEAERISRSVSTNVGMGSSPIAGGLGDYMAGGFEVIDVISCIMTIVLMLVR